MVNDTQIEKHNGLPCPKEEKNMHDPFNYGYLHIYNPLTQGE